jgi:RNA polymerase sigma-70 factor (ECF subfamily)
MARILDQLLPSLFTPSDEQLVWRMQEQDDSAAFGELAQRWEQPIRRLCERMTGDAHKAQDLAQDVFAKVFARRMEFRPDGKFSTFLWRVALNHCYDELRRRQRRGEFSLDELLADDAVALPGEEPSPADRLEERERGEAVRAVLQRLPEHYRAVVVLRHYEGLKFREIADVLSIPEGTVKSRMSEALDQLAVLLKEFNPPSAAENRDQPRQSICV